MHYLFIALNSALVYAFIIVAIRIFGKKEIAQLTIVDLVFILLISNAVQNSMLGDDPTFLGGVVSAVTLFVVNYALKFVLYRFPRLSTIVQGSPVMLIYDGCVIIENLTKSRISVDEIEEAAREHGVESLEDVNLAILEIDGHISILSDDYRKHTRKRKKFAKNSVL